MARARIVYKGVPFIVEGEGTPEQLAGSLKQRLEQNPALIDKRRQKLGMAEGEVWGEGQGYSPVQNVGQFDDQLGDPTEGMSGTEKFLVGAGKTFTSLGRGAKMLFTGDEDDAEILRREAHENELFDKLDSQGIGLEDLGQIAPDAIALLGSGGLTSLFGRGALMGAVRPGEDGWDRAKAGLTSGVLSIAGPGAAKAVAAILSAPTRVAGKGMSILLSRMGNEPAKGIGAATADAVELSVKQNAAMREVGDLALQRTADVIQRMNTFGKQTAAKEVINKAFMKAIKVVDGRNTLDTTAFNRALMTTSDAMLKKGAGKDFGRILGELRTTFSELGRLQQMTPQQAQQVLAAISDDGTAAALGRILAGRASEEAKKTAAEQLLARSGQFAASAPRAAVGGALSGEQ